MTYREVVRLDDAHWTVRGYKQRMTVEQLRRVLLEDADPIVAGSLCDVKHRDLGAGVVEVWLERRP